MILKGMKGKHWVNGTNPIDWRPIAGGGFYVMEKPTPPGPPQPPPPPPPPPSPFVASNHTMDPTCAGLLYADSTSNGKDDGRGGGVGGSGGGSVHTVAVVVDAGPQLVTFSVDGIVCDGGGSSPFGWFWLAAQMGQ